MSVDQDLVVTIAKVCYEANKAWCEAGGDYSQTSWSDAAQWQRESMVAGVRFKIDNPSAGDSAQHDAWSKDKIAAGWVYGEEKSAVLKTHPCLVPFNELPELQQKKDRLFSSIVLSLI
jgi:hypothetical protein